jgi:integrase/recombinase XerC
LGRKSEAPVGSARLELVRGVHLLHPEDAVFEAMLMGWTRQQRGGRNLQERTVTGRVATVRRFLEFCDSFPWRWRAADMDEWSTHLVSEAHLKPSTIRDVQGVVRMFCDFLLDPRYGWAQECEARFGTHPVQVCHEWNTVEHLQDYEGDPDRRPVTRDELQRLFDHIDDRVDFAIRHGRKGALTAYRDATLFKVMYGWGLRRTETSRLDLFDWYRNPKAPEFGRYGMLEVRFGKASRGQPPKRRTVCSTMPWAVEAAEDYIVNVRPRFKGHDQSTALWLTERGTRLSPKEIDERFALYRAALDLDNVLVPHCLRHSYVTHSVEDGVDPVFVQQQVGHDYASTTAIYTGVSGDFANSMMRKAVDAALHRDAQDFGHRGRGMR